MKIRPAETRVFLCGQTDGRPSAFWNLANAPKNSTICQRSAFIRFVRIWKQTVGTKAFQKPVTALSPLSKGLFPPRPNSVENFMKNFWLMHATTADLSPKVNF